MRIKSLNVTPKMAAQWLRRNQSNRPLRQAYVRALAEAMKRGEWAVTHQPIALNGEKLIDGQHRLGAVIESGLPHVRMTIAFDADTETFDTIDIGIRRSLSDIYREDRHVMNPVSFIGRLLYGTRLTPREIHPIYEKFKEPMRAFVALAHRGTAKFTAALSR